MDISGEDIEDLRRAKALLENPGMAAKVMNLFGNPIEKGFKLLPAGWYELVNKASKASLSKALDFAVLTVGERTRKRVHARTHRWVVASTGAAGGAFGLLALPVELPLSTIVMLRSIAEIARSHGEDLHTLETRLNCLEVFAMGGRSRMDDATDTGYFAVRTALARALSEAAQYVAERGIAERGAPALVRLIGAIAGRFSLVVSEKVLAQAVPVIGAAGGALINALFIRHFQEVAEGHFTIRSLERVYGPEEVRHQFEQPHPP